MSDDTGIITDKKLIHEIIETRFKTGTLYVKIADMNVQVQTYSYKNGLLSITLPNYNELITNVIFYTRDREEVTFSNAVLEYISENGTHVFELLDVQVLQIPRKEARKSVASIEKPETAALYISNIISDFTIQACIDSSRRRADTIKDQLLKQIHNLYPDTQILFLSDKTNDPRMLFCIKKRKPFFIRNIKDLDDRNKLENQEWLEYYKSYIYQPELQNHNSKIVSEICVPLLYKMMMPFGYIKTAHSSELDNKDFSAIRKFGMTASTVFTNDKQVIISSDEKIAVTDLSMSGLGIFFRNKVLIKHFKEKSLIIFSIYLPGNKHATFLCEVKNITLIQNYVYRVGCEIQNIEALGEVYYSEYLDRLM